MRKRLLPIALLVAALGNRAWGEKGQSRWVGVLMMTLACVIINPSLVIWSPIIYGLIFFFRVFETGETWLANTVGRNMWYGIARGLLIWPLAIFVCYIAHNINPLLVAAFFPLPALFYYVAGKISQQKCTEIGELLTGAYIVSVVL